MAPLRFQTRTQTAVFKTSPRILPTNRFRRSSRRPFPLRNRVSGRSILLHSEGRYTFAWSGEKAVPIKPCGGLIRARHFAACERLEVSTNRRTSVDLE
ncbi:MAG: hypothetical protein DME65_06900 [Verrucomicrobia bacterium]|nr:MAG: hypothetical protein DME65_06900 [Verrucomicrobiota bacterium]